VCEAAGVPAVAVVTAAFENLARTAARARGWPALRLLVLPHPLEPLPDDALRAIARREAATVHALLVRSA